MEPMMLRIPLGIAVAVLMIPLGGLMTAESDKEKLVKGEERS